MKELPLFSPTIISSNNKHLLLDDENQKEHETKTIKTNNNNNNNNNNNKLPLLPLMFLIYFQVSGGPYGQEPVVSAAGPFFAILGFIAFPILWSAPEALITAELSTAFPSNGGFVVWSHTAFGPFWAHLIGTWKFLAGVINLASFPGICINYVEAIAPQLGLSSTLTRYSVVLFSTMSLSVVNYTGLHVAGYAAMPLGILSLVPFLALSLAAIPKIDPSNWVVVNQVGRNKEWKHFFNSLLWNLNSWDSVSTLVGEVANPNQTLPKALMATLGFTSFTYLIPLLASLGAVSLDLDDWVEGYYADIAEEIAGPWLKRWVKLGSVLSGCGLYQAQLGSCSYQLEGMANIGLLPRMFGSRCPLFDTPWLGIVVSTIGALGVSAMRLEEMRTAVNFLYSMGMLVELGSFVILRVKLPEKERPFKIPIDGLRGLIGMCIVPGIVLMYVLSVAGLGVYVLSLVLSLLGVAFYFLFKLLRDNMWLQFNHVGTSIIDDDDDGPRYVIN